MVSNRIYYNIKYQSSCDAREHARVKRTANDDKLLFVDLEIVKFLDTLGCIVQFKFKKS